MNEHAMLERRSDLILFFLFISSRFCNFLCDRKVQVTWMNNLITENIMQTLDNSAVPRCADKCVYATDCMAIGFQLDTRTCHLNSINSSTALANGYLSEYDNAIVIDISNWIQGKTGGCWDRPCPPMTLCIPRNQTFMCIPYGCSSFVPPEHGFVDPANREYFGVGEKIVVGCNLPYLKTLVDPYTNWVSTCSANGLWGFDYLCYTIQDVCGQYLVENRLNNNSLTIGARNPYDDSWRAEDVLFSSNTGLEFENDVDIFVQVNFDNLTWIGGVATKGGPGNQYIGLYSVMYSISNSCITGGTWVDITDSNSEVKRFQGNTDSDTVVENYFEEPLEVRCIRVNLLGYNNALVIRLEVLGC